jgi:hypothetical protein
VTGAGQLPPPKRRELDQADTARQRLGRGTEERGARRTCEHEPSAAGCTIDGVAQSRKELGQPLRLVNHQPAWVPLEEAFKIRVKQGKIRRPLEVEVRPIRKEGANECALAALPRPVDKHGREVPQ